MIEIIFSEQNEQQVGEICKEFDPCAAVRPFLGDVSEDDSKMILNYEIEEVRAHAKTAIMVREAITEIVRHMGPAGARVLSGNSSLICNFLEELRKTNPDRGSARRRFLEIAEQTEIVGLPTLSDAECEVTYEAFKTALRAKPPRILQSV